MAHFPFSAIVGQETLKRALLLSVIQPTLGGVLIRGTKGVAKSTAVRALAGLLPPIEAVAGCPFQRAPGEVVLDWPMPTDVPVVARPVPLVELPLGATEDRLLGSLHLEKALRGERAFEPGLLAAANRGILYVDEVNLLPDHLVDILLDAAASGIHRVEREGLSLCHPARFVLIGTMNPEEGDLRPQLLDRFGLVADVKDLTDPADRAEAVRRRLAFEARPERFAVEWQAADAAEAERIVQAQRLLPEVRVPEAILQAAIERCVAAAVEGLRADLTLCRAASAWAAYHGRTEPGPEDLDAIAELALAHRRTRPPEPPPDGERGSAERGARNADRGAPSRERETHRGLASSRDAENSDRPVAALRAPRSALLHFDAAGVFAARIRPPVRLLAESVLPGRWAAGEIRRHGPVSGPVRRPEQPAGIAWSATVRAAAAYQIERGRHTERDVLILRSTDLRGRPRRGPAGCLLLFVLDTSGSMGAWRRMRQTKAAVLALLMQAYQRRDRVALLAFHGSGTEMVLAPARGLRPARQALERLPVGGTTPLAHGLASACRLIRREQRRQPKQPIWTVVLTDGRANVGSNGRESAAPATAWDDALAEARSLAACRTTCLVVDTEVGWPRFGGAIGLANALGAACVPLEEVLGRPVLDCWRQAV